MMRTKEKRKTKREQLLETIGEVERVKPLTAKELQNMTGFPKSTVQKALQELREAGAVNTWRAKSASRFHTSETAYSVRREGVRR